MMRQLLVSGLLLLAIRGTGFGGDEWLTWNHSDGPFGANIHALAAYPSGMLLAVGPGGAWRSQDHGATWEHSQVWVALLSLHLDDSGSTVAGAQNGVYRSADRGRTWNQINAELKQVIGVGTDPDGAIYAATRSSGVFRTSDGGQTWGQVYGEGLVQCFAMTSTGTLFLGLPEGVLVRSTDQGDSWVPTITGLETSVVHSLAEGPDGDLYAGPESGDVVYRSVDNGDTWTAGGSIGLEDVNVEAIAVGQDGRVYILVETWGLLESRDAGSTWTLANWRIHAGLLSLAVVGERLYVGTMGGGVFQGTDLAQPLVATNTGMIGTAIRGLLAEPDGAILAGTGGSGLFRSRDRGESWVALEGTRAMPHVSALLFDAQGRLLAAGGGVPVVCRSGDGGATWIRLGPEHPQWGPTGPMAIGPGGEMIMATWQEGLRRSTDDGASWQPINVGIADTALSIHGVLYASNGRLLAGGFGGLHQSMDLGDSWTRITAGLPDEGAGSVVEVDDGALFATVGVDVYRSRDGGDSWTPVGGGFPARSLAALPGGGLLVGTWDSKVFRTLDGGQSWRELGNHLGPGPVLSLLADRDGYVYAGSASGGAYRTQFPIATAITESENLPAAFSLAAAYPNPFNSSTVLKYSLREPGLAGLTIHDVGGQRVTQLVSQWLNAGEYRVTWNGKDRHGHAVGSGTYFARLKVGAAVRTRKLMLVR